MNDDSGQSAQSPQRLKPNVIGPWGLAALAIGITSPAMGLYALWAPMQALAGPITPLVFLAAMVVILPTAISYAALNQHAPSAGAAASWLWVTASPSLGYLAGLVMLSYFLIVSISQPLLFALFFRDFVDYLGLRLPVRASLALGIAIEAGVVGWICLRGAEASIRTTVRLMVVETLVVLALSATILWNLDGPVTLAPVDPASATNGLGGFWAAMILGVLAFCGFDVVSTAAEEAQAPRDFVPRAILYTVVGVALFWSANAYILSLAASHAEVLRYNAQGLTAITPIAGRYWGAGNLIVILTAFTGLIAVYISCVQGASRILFALARHRLLPSRLAALEGERHIPRVAILSVILICVTLGLLSLALFPDGLAGFVWWSNGLVFFALLTFTGVNVANLLYFRRVRPDAFNPLRNLIIPLLGAGANLYLIWAAFFSALWDAPLASGRSVVIFCVLLLTLLCAAVAWVRRYRPALLARGEPIGADVQR